MNIKNKEDEANEWMKDNSKFQVNSFKLLTFRKGDSFIKKKGLHCLPTVLVRNKRNETGCLVIYSHGNSSDLGDAISDCLIISSHFNVQLSWRLYLNGSVLKQFRST